MLRTPFCGTRKNVRVQSIPPFFRPQQQSRTPCIRHRRRSCSLPAPSVLGFESFQSIKIKAPPEWVVLLFGGEGGTRTLAPGFSRPTPLAGAPRHQLEYFSIVTLYDPLFTGDFLGGEGRIRTHGSFESPVFKTGSLNHSDTSPDMFLDFSTFSHKCQPIIYVFLGKKIDRSLEIWYNPFNTGKRDKNEQDGTGLCGRVDCQYDIRI